MISLQTKGRVEAKGKKKRGGGISIKDTYPSTTTKEMVESTVLNIFLL